MPDNGHMPRPDTTDHAAPVADPSAASARNYLCGCDAPHCAHGLCDPHYDAARYAAHAEERRAHQAAYDAIHAEEIAARHAAYNAAHTEERAAYGRIYRAAHPVLHSLGDRITITTLPPELQPLALKINEVRRTIRNLGKTPG